MNCLEVLTRSDFFERGGGGRERKVKTGATMAYAFDLLTKDLFFARSRNAQKREEFVVFFLVN